MSRWAMIVTLEAAYVLMLGVLSVVPAAIIYDLTRFAEIRAEINNALAEASSSERRPSAEVRQTFAPGEVLDSGIYRLAANMEYGHQLDMNSPRHYPSFWSGAEPVVVWAPLLRFRYDNKDLATFVRHREGASLWRRGPADLALATFGRDLNDLSLQELQCLARVLRVHRFPEQDCAVLEPKLRGVMRAPRAK